MPRQTFSVEDIYQGVDSTAAIKYPAAFVTATGLATGRLVVHFRASPSNAIILHTADSDVAGSIVRTADTDGGMRVDIAIPKIQSANFPIPKVWFDILRIDGAARRVLPGYWTWTVKTPITRNVA